MLCKDQMVEDEGISEEVTKDLSLMRKAIELSRHSVAGINSPKTLKLPGKIQGVSIVVLIYSGVTHSFISQHLVTNMQIHVLQKDFQVTISNGETIKGGGICSAVPMQLSDMYFIQDY